jgi:hypothetical protein
MRAKSSFRYFGIFEARYLAAFKANLDASESVGIAGGGTPRRSSSAVALEDMLTPHGLRCQTLNRTI